MTTDLIEAATRWLEEDPDPDTRAELSALIAAGDTDALADRFGARLQFGTAGLRGALGAGPNRMNRVIVRRAAAGLAHYLLDQVPGAADAGVVIGCDARHKSDVFAEDTAAVLAGRVCARCSCRRSCRPRCSRSPCAISVAPLE